MIVSGESSNEAPKEQLSSMLAVRETLRHKYRNRTNLWRVPLIFQRTPKGYFIAALYKV